MVKKCVILVTFVCLFLTGVFSYVGTPVSDLSNSSDSFVPSEETIIQMAEMSLNDHFFENLGQIDVDDILYYGSIPGGTIGFGESKCYLWIDGSKGWIVLSFEGSRPVQPEGLEEVGYFTHYFLGDRGTFTDVRGFYFIKYSDLWPGIDLQYVMSLGGAKYEFLVSPGADPADIRIQSEGHDVLSLETTCLRIQRDDGVLVDEGLRVFQSQGDIEARFVDYDSNCYGFNIGSYDRSETLVIDPLLYSTYIGGGGPDEGYGIEVDDSGNVYVTGLTFSSGFPILDAYDDTQGGYSDSFVLKLNATGNGILYSTFVGGGGEDYGNSIAIDENGNAYVTGDTSSSDFPIQNYYDNSHNGGDTDCFVFKLSATGDSLVYSTFIGGDGDDVGRAIVVDGLYNAYVTGHTSSSNFPTENALNTTNNGGVDVFILKLNSGGDSLSFSTYLGGNNLESGYGIAIDDNSNVYVTGATWSSIFPTINAFDNSYNGNSDGFVLKLNSTGTDIIYSTFVGDTGWDMSYGIAVDSSFNAYVTGNTASSNFPLENEYDSAMNGASDAFVLKLNATGNGLHYSTFIGGAGEEAGRSIDLDSSNQACITGEVDSSDFPTVNPLLSGYGGATDCFVVRLSAAGNALNYSTYIGGEDTDTGRCITVADNDLVYMTGYTSSNQFPIFNAFEPDPQGSSDCFVLGLDMYGVDLEGPLILAYLPDTPWGYNDIYIHALVTDASGMNSVTLSYSINDQSSWINVTMTYDSGVHRFSGYIPNADCVGEDIVYYKVYATDRLDNEEVTAIVQFTALDSMPTGPQITDIWRSPENPSQFSQVTVTASITDYSGIAEAILAFDIGFTWTNVTMTNTAGDTWSGTIPNKADGGQVYFKIYARDNVGYWSELYTDEYYVSVDDQDPNIMGFDPLDEPWEDNDVTIFAYVDDDTQVAFVTLHYSIDGGDSWTAVNMTYEQASSEWRAPIPGQPAGTTVFYWIHAEDIAGNSVDSETRSYYVYDSGGSPAPDQWMAIAGASFSIFFFCCICGTVVRRRRGREPIPMIAPTHVAVPTDIKAMRGGEIIGGRFEYKVKVKNESEYVINNVTVAIIAYPKDCMTLEGEAVKTLARIEPGGFRSPQFIFTPSKDCVEGEIIATVSYVDIHNDPQVLAVEPYTIRSVCDLLTPLETTMDQFDLILGDMTTASEKHELDWNPEVLFQKAETLLPAKNFHIIEATGQTEGGLFTGIIRGLAEGKYTGKKVAVRIRISGKVSGHKSMVTIEGLGDDLAMIPTTIHELAEGIASWICLNCSAALDPSEVSQIKAKIPVQCRYCGNTLTLELYTR